MNDKHFIWIIPTILIVGFVLGFIAGFKIPKDVKFGIDSETIAFMEDGYLTQVCETQPYYNYAYCMLNSSSFNKYGVAWIHEVCYNGTIRGDNPYQMNDKGEYI